MVDEFYQREPDERAPVSEKTQFFTCYDEHYIYFAVKCWDNPDDITAKEMARDGSLANDDRIQIILDTYKEGSPIPVNYGARFTGLHKDWNIVFLHINDSSETGNQNFSVLRISPNIGKQSVFGITGTPRGNAVTPSDNLLAGADVKISTSTFQGNKNAAVILFGLKSATNNINSENSAWGA